MLLNYCRLTLNIYWHLSARSAKKKNVVKGWVYSGFKILVLKFVCAPPSLVLKNALPRWIAFAPNHHLLQGQRVSIWANISPLDHPRKKIPCPPDQSAWAQPSALPRLIGLVGQGIIFLGWSRGEIFAQMDTLCPCRRWWVGAKTIHLGKAFLRSKEWFREFQWFYFIL